MQLTDFYERVYREFGQSLGNFYLKDTVLTELSLQTANAAIDAGVDLKTVWLAMCKEFAVPESHWY